jgi:hypothetical protein
MSNNSHTISEVYITYNQVDNNGRLYPKGVMEKAIEEYNHRLKIKQRKEKLEKLDKISKNEK